MPNRPLLLPHEQLLLACAKSGAGERVGPEVEAALSHPGFHWPAFVAGALRHGLAQAAAVCLCDLAADPRIPPEILTALGRAYRGNAVRNRVLFREIARLARALEGAGIACMVLKGPALALTVYSDSTLRHFADIDILVPASSYAAAVDAAQQEGFVREFPEMERYAAHQTCVGTCAEDILTDAMLPEFNPALTPPVLAANRHTVRVEIHPSLFRSLTGRWRAVEEEPLWESAQTIRLPDQTPIRIPSSELMLVHLAVHANGHDYDRLLYAMDLAALLLKVGSSMDWERVVHLSRCFQTQHSVYLALDLAAREFGASIPQNVLRLLQPDGRRTERRVQISDFFWASGASSSAVFLHRWLQARGQEERMRTLLGLFFPPPVQMRRIYGAKNPLLLASLYLYRPFQLAGRLIRVLAREKVRLF